MKQINTLLLCTAFTLMMFIAPVQADEPRADGYKTAVFAGGCFWSMERSLDSIKGVVKTTSGFSGGHVVNPDYYQVVNGGTGHREAVEVVYDPKKITYRALTDAYFRSIDPTDAGGQFCDRGETYSTAIFYKTEAEGKSAASAKLQAEYDIGKPVMTRLIAYDAFYPAEEFHQDYHIKQNKKYKFYRGRCGHDKRLNAVWGWDALIPEDK